MEQVWFLPSLAILLLLLASSPTFSTSSSDGVWLSANRHLLQAKKACPIQFQFLNYTIITSQCKAPKYPPNLCCPAFKKFACPYAKELNDMTTDCASTMFSYINLYGKYPPGLFATECREGKIGLKCPESPPAADTKIGN